MRQALLAAAMAGATPAHRTRGAARLDGVHLRLSDGSILRYRCTTALGLMAWPIREAFADCTAALGFTFNRVLTMAAITCSLPPDVGVATLASWLFPALRQRGQGVELVLLADSGDYVDDATGRACYNLSDDQIRAHVRACATAIAQDGADLPVLVELANENAHPSQSRSLQNVAFLQELRAIVKGIAPWVPVSLGSTCCGLPDTLPAYGLGGDYITLHLDRGRTPWWDEVRRVKDLVDTQAMTHQLVANDEPIGAAEVDQPGRRSAIPERFFVQGVLDRLGELAGTCHTDAGVSGTLPGAVQTQCMRAYLAGATIVSDDHVFVFHNDSNPGAATVGADWTDVEKLFTFENVTGGPSYVVALNEKNPDDLSIHWANGWQPVGQLETDYPGIVIIEVRR